MSWLFIDTTRPGVCRVGLLSSQGSHVRSYKQRASRLLVLIERLIKKDFSFLDGVCVVSGPGSFSSVRAGVLVANILAHHLSLPLVGIDVFEAQDLKALSQQLLKRFTIHDPRSTTVLPIYDAEPNITIPMPSMS